MNLASFLFLAPSWDTIQNLSLCNVSASQLGPKTSLSHYHHMISLYKCQVSFLSFFFSFFFRDNDTIYFPILQEGAWKTMPQITRASTLCQMLRKGKHSPDLEEMYRQMLSSHPRHGIASSFPPGHDPAADQTVCILQNFVALRSIRQLKVSQTLQKLVPGTIRE